MNLNHAWLKSYIRYPLDARRAEKYLIRGAETSAPATTLEFPSTRSIVVEMHTPQLLFDCGRHLNCIAAHASLAGSRFYLRCSKVLLAGIARKLYGPELLSNPSLTWLSPGESSPSDSLVLTDDASRCRDSQAIEMLIGRDCVSETPTMPYPMHHRTTESHRDSAWSELRESDRRGIFFAGRIKESYKRNKITGEFGVIDRVSAVRTVQDRFGSRVLETLQARDTSQDSMPIVLLDSGQHGIDQSQWLPTLTTFDFFLCCPGASQPMCHNAIEAMSVGTIPLIEYGDRFSPPLSDSINAVCFSGEEGLIAAIERIDQMSPEQICDLRAGVIDYFETHLRGDKFLANLRDGKFGPQVSAVNMPFHSHNYFTRSAA
jgi:hypothetical protein